jgi:hypothetical protein
MIGELVVEQPYGASQLAQHGADPHLAGPVAMEMQASQTPNCHAGTSDCCQ